MYLDFVTYFIYSFFLCVMNIFDWNKGYLIRSKDFVSGLIDVS